MGISIAVIAHAADSKSDLASGNTCATGFYSFATLAKIMGRTIHFIIPAKKDFRLEVLRKLAESDYLCRIKDPLSEKTPTVRGVFVHRNSFRRRP